MSLILTVIDIILVCGLIIGIIRFIYNLIRRNNTIDNTIDNSYREVINRLTEHIAQCYVVVEEEETSNPIAYNACIEDNVVENTLPIANEV